MKVRDFLNIINFPRNYVGVIFYKFKDNKNMSKDFKYDDLEVVLDTTKTIKNKDSEGWHYPTKEEKKALITKNISEADIYLVDLSINSYKNADYIVIIENYEGEK